MPKPFRTRHSYNRQMQQNHVTITFLCAFLAMGKLLQLLLYYSPLENTTHRVYTVVIILTVTTLLRDYVHFISRSAPTCRCLGSPFSLAATCDSGTARDCPVADTRDRNWNTPAHWRRALRIDNQAILERFAVESLHENSRYAHAGALVLYGDVKPGLSWLHLKSNNFIVRQRLFSDVDGPKVYIVVSVHETFPRSTWQSL